MTHRIAVRCLAAATTVAAAVAVFALAPSASGTGGPRPTLAWTACPDDIPDLPVAPDDPVKCATLRLPVDWAKPRGATFELWVARRPARNADQRVGTLVFGPGGPGDSGVERIRRGNRFSGEILDKFDTVSFDPRGVARSGGPRCSPDPTVPKPPMLLTGQGDFDATIAYNRALWDACRHTSPVFDHADTLSTVRDLDALRRALGESKLTFHGSSYGTLLGVQYAERYPGRVRAIVLESVFDHSLDLRTFVRAQAITLQDSFDEFVAWCDRSTDCVLHGQNVRGVWADVLARADRGEYAPYTSFDVAAIPIGVLARPDWPRYARAIQSLSNGTAVPAAIPPLTTAVFCNDWPVPLRSYEEYAELVDTAAAVAPDVRYGGGLVAVVSCLGWPAPVRNPIRVPRVRTNTPLLLLNALHDPRTGYEWATHVAAQLGKHGRLVTYEGWGHGAYGSTPCTTAAVDRYLINLAIPAPGTRCPAP
ncbi:alpha/beta hydrolase [Micromonospora sp. CPCC 206061]|uniref:alpha/beta hydrolase n=1 Tax=Micromonospora sp. CPCC 206061 TaxID=3122410 RepID=UPI002FF0F4BB